MPAKMLGSKAVDWGVLHRLERTSASENVGLQRVGVDCEIPHRLERGTSSSEDVGPRRGWIVRSHIGWKRGTKHALYGVETSPQQIMFKNIEGKLERESPKRIISTSGTFSRRPN